MKERKRGDNTMLPGLLYQEDEIKQDKYSKRYLTPEEILVKSSNVGAGLIGLEIGNERMKEY